MSETPQAQHEKTAVVLAYAGAAPFLALTLMSFLHVAPDFALAAMTAYSLAIIAFLGGSWWGMALVMREISTSLRTMLLVASNLVVIFAVAMVVLFPGTVAIFALAGAYVALVFLERRLPGLSRQPAYYRAMRNRVSMIAAGSHLLFGWAISAV